MTREFDDDAVILRTYKSGESDRVVVSWTRAHGKVRAIAKGARKTSSAMAGTLEVLAWVRASFVATRGELFVVRHARHLARLTTLRGDYERINAGYAVVEVLDALPSEGVSDEALYELTVRVLAALDDARYDPTLVPASFYLRLLAHDGSAPVLDACVNCGCVEPLVAFDARVGGVLCERCRSGRPLSASALTLLRRLTGGSLSAVLSGAPPDGASEVATLVRDALEEHVGRRLHVERASAQRVARDAR